MTAGKVKISSNTGVQYSGTYHQNKMAGTWKNVDVGGNGTFLLVHQATKG